MSNAISWHFQKKALKTENKTGDAKCDKKNESEKKSESKLYYADMTLQRESKGVSMPQKVTLNTAEVSFLTKSEILDSGNKQTQKKKSEFVKVVSEFFRNNPTSPEPIPSLHSGSTSDLSRTIIQPESELERKVQEWAVQRLAILLR